MSAFDWFERRPNYHSGPVYEAYADRESNARATVAETLRCFGMKHSAHSVLAGTLGAGRATRLLYDHVEWERAEGTDENRRLAEWAAGIAEEWEL